MAHEIAHAKRSHVAQLAKKSAIPQLLASLLGMGAAVATGDPAAMIVAQGVNESLQLSYTPRVRGRGRPGRHRLHGARGLQPDGHGELLRPPARPEGRAPGRPAARPTCSRHPRVEQRLDDAIARARATTIPGKARSRALLRARPGPGAPGAAARREADHAALPSPRARHAHHEPARSRWPRPARAPRTRRAPWRFWPEPAPRSPTTRASRFARRSS